jgi:uncharacterized glyoxalase superfamily protein PhnB
MNPDLPPRYPPLSAVLTVPDADAAVAFYARAFGAVERFRLTDPVGGRVAHVELEIQGGLVMLAEGPSPLTPPGTPTIRLCLHVLDVDAMVRQASASGALVQRPPKDEFYGHRCAKLLDPFGHEWMVFAENEPVAPSEMQRRWNDLAEGAKLNR